MIEKEENSRRESHKNPEIQAFSPILPRPFIHIMRILADAEYLKPKCRYATGRGQHT